MPLYIDSEMHKRSDNSDVFNDKYTTFHGGSQGIEVIIIFFFEFR